MSASTVAANGAACSTPDTPAVVQVEPAMLPSILTAYEEHGTDELIVTIDPNTARPTNVKLAQPSGDAILDAAAMQVARETSFTPETQSCSPVGGEYFYDFAF
ncbi:MAG: TonB family protein [Candidatus Eremiobacteraeota bacterium]|nr:TonB family protein [Candidatus Eremiobacteraeota bacterium]